MHPEIKIKQNKIYKHGYNEVWKFLARIEPKFGQKHETRHVELIPISLPAIHMKTVSHIQLITCCNLLQLLGCILRLIKIPCLDDEEEKPLTKFFNS
jgi:hypothetical protein